MSTGTRPPLLGAGRLVAWTVASSRHRVRTTTTTRCLGSRGAVCRPRTLCLSVTLAVAMSDGGRTGTSSAAKRRRERRLRAAWRHEQLSVRMALAAPKCAGPEKHEAPRGQTTARAAAGAQLFCLDLDEAPVAGGSRPDRLPEVRPQKRVQRHTVDLIVAAPLLDVPVPLVEEQLVDASALAFLEEAEATDLAAEYMELVRYGFMSSPASERMREVIQRRHVLRQKGRGRKKKKKRKKRLPRSSRPRLPRTDWFFSGYMFLPRSRRLLGTISALFQREGGPWLLRSILAASCPYGSLQAQDARHLGRYGPEGHLCRDTEFASVARAVRTWKPGLSASHWYLAVTCSVLVLPAECCGGFFWEITSGFLPVISAIWFNSGYMCLSVYGGLGLAGCDAPRAVFLRGCQALMRCIMAGMDQQEQFMALCTKLRKFRSFSSSWSSSSSSLCRGRSPWSL